MSSLLKSTGNTRALPVGTMRYIRSDAPLNLTEEEIQWLSDNHISTLVDLRSDEEVSEHPCELAVKEGFQYYHLPVTGGGDIPKSREHLHTVYAQMIDEQMKKIIDTIMSAKSNVLYFCTAGKDRTGVVSAVLLRKLGYSDEIIIEDYMRSKDNLIDMLTAYVKEHPEVDREIIIPRVDNITELLKDSAFAALEL